MPRTSLPGWSTMRLSVSIAPMEPQVRDDVLAPERGLALEIFNDGVLDAVVGVRVLHYALEQLRPELDVGAETRRGWNPIEQSSSKGASERCSE